MADGRVVCPVCLMALAMADRTAFTVRHGRAPLSIEELIAEQVLGQVIRERPVNPRVVGVIPEPGTQCARCVRVLVEEASKNDPTRDR